LHRYPYLAPRLGAPRSTRACHTFPVLVIGTSHRGVASLQSSLSSYTHRLTSLALSLYVAKFIPPDAVAVAVVAVVVASAIPRRFLTPRSSSSSSALVDARARARERLTNDASDAPAIVHRGRRGARGRARDR
jgi:hypothetical protein